MIVLWITLLLLHRGCKCCTVLLCAVIFHVSLLVLLFFPASFILTVLIYLHCFHLAALIPVTTAQLGGSITFTCLLPNTEIMRRDVCWYKQTLGDTLKIIWALKESESPQFAPEFTPSRWKVNYDKKFSNLTILRINQEDEGIYHCGITEWRQDTKWTGTYLLVKGNNVFY